MENGKWPGTWKVVCDVCGFWFASDKIKDRWDGLKVCHKDWEIKHPQLTIKVFPETITPPFVRPSPADVFVPYCTIETSKAIPGIGQPGCLIPGSNQVTLYCTPTTRQAIPGFGQAGCFTPSFTL